VIVKARVVRHRGARFRAAPLARHIAYLEREGVTRDGADARMFDANSDSADERAFAERCDDDRHHFRFIISPEDAGEMADLRTFTRELMADAERDLGTRLDWVAVDHWNTDNPHIHVLLRGKQEDGQDLVINPDYIRSGVRDRAQARVSMELGPRSEREISAALAREAEAERWTGSMSGSGSLPTRAAVSSTYVQEARTMIRNCGGCCSDAPQSLNVWVSPSRSDRVVGR
jgi:type IV secretory pathway VirD2 relaxase